MIEKTTIKKVVLGASYILALDGKFYKLQLYIKNEFFYFIFREFKIIFYLKLPHIICMKTLNKNKFYKLNHEI